MLNSPKIEFYKQREFGDKINITFAFIRQNAKDYFKYQLFIAGPFIAIGVILSTLFFNTFSNSLLVSDPYNPDVGLSAISSAMGYGFFTVLMYGLVYLLIAMVGMGYLRAYHENPEGKVLRSDITARVWPKLPAALGAAILGYICIVIGSLLFIIPGIYLAVAFSLIFVIIMFEDKGGASSLGRSIDLIKGKWWSTFGLIFVMGLIAAAIGYVIQLPTYLAMFMSDFNSLDDPEKLSTLYGGTLFGLVNSLLYYLGILVTVFIVQTAVAFQYFNLIERKESRGLMSKIQDMGQPGEADDEHY